MFSTYNKIYALCVIIVFIVPNLCSVIKGRESFPFTPAPMFSHYVGDDENFYDFVFTGLGDTVEKVLIPTHTEHKNQLAIKRYFFDKIYGSVEKNSPLWDNQNDTKEAFEERLSGFFRVYFKNLENNNIKHIRLEVKQYDHHYFEISSHLVGSFDISTKHFTKTWGKNQ